MIVIGITMEWRMNAQAVIRIVKRIEQKLFVFVKAGRRKDEKVYLKA